MHALSKNLFHFHASIAFSFSSCSCFGFVFLVRTLPVYVSLIKLSGLCNKMEHRSSNLMGSVRLIRVCRSYVVNLFPQCFKFRV